MEDIPQGAGCVRLTVQSLDLFRGGVQAVLDSALDLHPNLLIELSANNSRASILSVNTDEYVTADEAAELLGIERRSVYTYVHRLKGFPQPTKIGRTLLFDRQALISWRKAHPARKRDSPPA